MAKNKYETKIKQREGELIDFIREYNPTDSSISEFLGISRTSFYKYMKDYPEFSQLIDNALRTSYRKIENELYKNAVGYDTQEVTEEFGPDGKVKSRKITRKHINGDLSSQKFILQNRQRMRWDNDDQPSVKINNNIDFSSFTKEELLKMLEDDDDE